MAWLGMAERGLAWQVWQGAAGSGEERTGLEWHGRRGRVGLGVARRATEWHGRLGLACPGKAGLVKAGKAGHGGERRGWARRGRLTYNNTLARSDPGYLYPHCYPLDII